MKINAMVIDLYKDSGGPLKSNTAGPNTAALIVRFAEILDQLEPQGIDNFHTIWVKAHRPKFRQYYDRHYGYDEPYPEASPKTLNSAQEEYEAFYPLPNVWYQLSVKHFTKRSDEEFYAFFIDHNCVFTIKDSKTNPVLEAEDLLAWAIREAEAFVSEVLKGTCEKNILNKIPYIYRKGKIKRKDLWEVCPKSKKDFFKPYDKREIKKFFRYFSSETPGNAMLTEMTTRIYYEACAVIYKALDMQRETPAYNYVETDAERERYGGVHQTPKEQYYALAEGRDDGLKNVPMDDPAAFEAWTRYEGPYYKFNGSHPWEIIPSFSTSFSMHLYPEKSESNGWYFGLAGNSDIRAPETIVAANALYEAGYPVVVYGTDEIIARIEGTDYIPVVPITEYTFFRECINLPEGDTGLAVAKKTIWKFDEYRLN
ncbi:MAG: hypothetical protein J5585_02830 [Clostridia bacterium]|nr:hypothetical protein [Clostridia bacterium]